VDHEAFIDVVRAAAALNRDGAERATRATLHTLAERIDRGEARDLAARLPPELAPCVATTTSAERFDVDELVRRVAQREGVDVPTAYRHARAVFDALARAVGPDELADVAAELSKDYAALLPRGPYVEPVPAERFVAAVAERAGLDADAARRATDATLETLAERIAGGEVRDLIMRLPIGLHGPLTLGTQRNGGQAQPMSPERFMRHIAEREGVTPDVARLHARAVFAALREAVGDDEFFDVTVQLPPDLVAALALT
jgi:uncharacterized protein (DUF2267 family)